MTDGQGSVVNLCYEFVAQTSRMTYKLVSGVYTDDRVINTTRAAETMRIIEGTPRATYYDRQFSLSRDPRTGDKFVRGSAPRRFDAIRFLKKETKKEKKKIRIRILRGVARGKLL